MSISDIILKARRAASEAGRKKWYQGRVVGTGLWSRQAIRSAPADRSPWRRRPKLLVSAIRHPTAGSQQTDQLQRPWL